MRILLFSLTWMALATAALADPAPVRVAVISTPETANLAALVTTELCNSPDLSLVERDELAKAGDELKLQQMAGSDAIALGKLLNADGLLFLNKGAESLQLRFTAVEQHAAPHSFAL